MNYIKNTAKFGSNLGLTRTEKILEFLGNPHKKIKSIHVAGTNGKGSTTAMISSILYHSGYKVGMYTSPYLEEFEERIQINNNNIPKEALSNLVSRVSEAVEKVVAMGYDHPTEFEIITCVMFLYFYEERVDYAVIEVGLGGRLDSTNVIIPIISVITSISYDHMNILGDTLEKIAYEKGGIIKNAVPVILYPQNENVLSVIKNICIEKECRLIQVDTKSANLIESDGLTQNINVKTLNNNYTLKLALLGKYQLLNCSLALHAIDELILQGVRIDYEAIKKGLYEVRWSGRLEVMNLSPKVIIDGAHNIDGIKKLCESIETFFKYDRLFLILGILADKQVNDMVKAITTKAQKVFAVTPNSERAELADELMKVVISNGIDCEAYTDYREAFDLALNECKDSDMLLICGSLYMIGDMRKIIKKHYEI
jgi:dihydrofolate synthase/folylpolyglutamate synthase